MKRAFRTRAVAPVAVLAGTLLFASALAWAGDPDSPSIRGASRFEAAPAGGTGDRWLSLAALGGVTLPDRSLDDYQWQIAPHSSWGAEALVGRGAWAAGLRTWTTATHQEVGAPGAPSTTRVSTTSWEAVARSTVASVRAISVSLGASVGRVRLAYAPDRVTIATAGGPLEVAFAPVTDWVGGAGLGFQRPLGPRWRAGLQVEHRIFALDTAHRSGDQIIEERSTFGDWSARVALERKTHW